MAGDRCGNLPTLYLLRLPSTCWLDLVFSGSSSCWHSTAKRSWYWSCHCPAQNYEGFLSIYNPPRQNKIRKNIYNSNVDRVVPNSLFLITIKWGRGEGFTSTSGLCERRLEMRRLLICLFSSWDFMSSSWIIKFLVGLFRWWTSFRACFSTSLKKYIYADILSWKWQWQPCIPTYHPPESWPQAPGEVYWLQQQYQWKRQPWSFKQNNIIHQILEHLFCIFCS